MAEGECEERDFACHIRTSLGLSISGLLLMIGGVVMIVFGYNAELFATVTRFNATTNSHHNHLDQQRLEMYKVLNYVGSCVFGVAVFFFVIVLVVFLEYQQFLRKINGPGSGTSALERKRKSFYRKVMGAFKRSSDDHETGRGSVKSPELAAYLNASRRNSRRSGSVGSPGPGSSFKSMRGDALPTLPICVESDVLPAERDGEEDKGQANLLSPEWSAKKEGEGEEVGAVSSYIKAPSCPVLQKDSAGSLKMAALRKFPVLPAIESAASSLPPSPGDVLLSPAEDLQPSSSASDTNKSERPLDSSRENENCEAVALQNSLERPGSLELSHAQVNVNVKVRVMTGRTLIPADSPSDEHDV